MLVHSRAPAVSSNELAWSALVSADRMGVVAVAPLGLAGTSVLAEDGWRCRSIGGQLVATLECLADDVTDEEQLLAGRRDLERSSERIVEIGADACGGGERPYQHGKQHPQLHRRKEQQRLL
eukprot:720390-Prymnesium_polylepis.1